MYSLTNPERMPSRTRPATPCQALFEAISGAEAVVLGAPNRQVSLATNQKVRVGISLGDQNLPTQTKIVILKIALNQRRLKFGTKNARSTGLEKKRAKNAIFGCFMRFE